MRCVTVPCMHSQDSAGSPQHTPEPVLSMLRTLLIPPQLLRTLQIPPQLLRTLLIPPQLLGLLLGHPAQTAIKSCASS